MFMSTYHGWEGAMTHGRPVRIEEGRLEGRRSKGKEEIN